MKVSDIYILQEETQQQQNQINDIKGKSVGTYEEIPSFYRESIDYTIDSPIENLTAYGSSNAGFFINTSGVVLFSTFEASCQAEKEIRIACFGKNMLQSVKRGALNNAGAEIASTTGVISDHISVYPATEYSVSDNHKTLNNSIKIFYYNNMNQVIKFNDMTWTGGTFVTPSTCTTIRLYTNKTNSAIDPATYEGQIEKGKLSTDYEKFTQRNLSVPLPEGVDYITGVDGAVCDKANLSTGELTKECHQIIITGNETVVLSEAYPSTTEYVYFDVSVNTLAKEGSKTLASYKVDIKEINTSKIVIGMLKTELGSNLTAQGCVNKFKAWNAKSQPLGIVYEKKTHTKHSIEKVTLNSHNGASTFFSTNAVPTLISGEFLIRTASSTAKIKSDIKELKLEFLAFKESMLKEIEDLKKRLP